MFYEPTRAMDPHAWEDAWPPVVDAVCNAMDVPGLPPADRGALAKIFEIAEPFVGRTVLRPPSRGATHTRLIDQKAAVADGPGGIHELVRYLESSDVQIYWALYRAGVLTIRQVCDMRDADLLKVDRIGPARRAALRAAIDAHAADAEVIA